MIKKDEYNNDLIDFINEDLLNIFNDKFISKNIHDIVIYKFFKFT